MRTFDRLFLPAVRSRTFAVPEDLDGRDLPDHPSHLAAELAGRRCIGYTRPTALLRRPSLDRSHRSATR